MMLCLFRMTCGFSFWTLTILVYDAHVMIFFTWTKFETLMYELMYECMMKVPLSVFFFTKVNDVCMIRYESMHEAYPCVFFTFYIVSNLFQLILNLLLFLDLWNPSILIFSLKNIIWSNQFIEKLFLYHYFFNTIWVTYMKFPNLLEGIR